MTRLPFQERKTSLRGALDLITGCYPRFLFGGPVHRVLPVFHFHDVTPDYLEPHLKYLAENGYHTVTTDALEQFVLRGVYPGADRVVLTFDDAWASLWTVAAPLLRKYGFSAIAYVIPGRVEEATGLRPTMEKTEGVLTGGLFGMDSPFATWAELRALQESGVVDIQAHTFSHGMMFCSTELTGFVTPESFWPPLSWATLRFAPDPFFVLPEMLGCPLYFQRSRMSDALRFLEDEEAREDCMRHVRERGGARFFRQSGWKAELTRKVLGMGRFETEEEQRAEIRRELETARDRLREKLGKEASQVCFPWGVCGKLAEALTREAGYRSGVADQLFGRRSATAGQNPYRIMRLKHSFIFCLPGKSRRSFRQARSGGRSL